MADLPLFHSLRDTLNRVANGAITVDQAVAALGPSWLEVATGGTEIARFDHERTARCGHPEIIYGQSKEAADIVAILRSVGPREQGALVSRVDSRKAEQVLAQIPNCQYHARAQIIELPRPKVSADLGPVAVICAGTSDLAVADEARIVLQHLGVSVRSITDIGIAGIHRLFAALPEIRQCRVIIAIAGMDGALPTVVAGLVDAPVFAVPTSVGYGVAAGGVAALHTMLASCAPGLSVVNIDNGVGAAIAAFRVVRQSVQGGPASGQATGQG